MPDKRAAESSHLGSSKKARRGAPKFRSIPNTAVAEGTPRTGSTSSPPTEVIQDARSFQVYTLSDGRLGLRRDDSTVCVPVLPPAGQAASVEWEASAVADGAVSAVLSELPVDQAESLHPSFPPYTKKQRKRPELRAASKIREWLPLRQEFLDELLRYFGGEFLHNPQDQPLVTCTAQGCGSLRPRYRCSDCNHRRLYCKKCVVARHEDLCLHRIQHWNGLTFDNKSLRDLGMVVQLGHNGDPCTSPSSTTRRLIVGDITGIHEVQVRFCGCQVDSEDHTTHEWVQLFRHGWFPATTNRPATAFTFRMLNTFQELTFQAKTNLYDFWKALERITDNTGAAPPLDRYKQVSHCVRIWRHLMALKRAGRAHDPAGAAATKPGDLAVECPACPHPGKNLPTDWENAAPAVKWLYTLYLMMDANFRAKLKDRGLDDIELGPAWSYFVESTSLQEHLINAGPQTETNGCSAEHRAILNANLRREGYIASGVGAVLCARHALVRRTAAGDIPNGKRYAIMDYLYFSTLVGLTLLLLISYDIACQWHKNLPKRIKDLPAWLEQDAAEHLPKMRYAIPKKHIAVHGPNHSNFSLNFLPNVGRTYGEGVESQWMHINPLSLSTREMAPGMRHEVMNDHWGAWNWQKVIGLGNHLLHCLKEAVSMAASQRAAHTDLTANIPPDILQKWEAELEAWNQSPGNVPDPFEEPRATATLKSTRLQIAEEEAAELAAGTLPPHDVSPGVFLQVGLELEEQQWALRARQKRTSSNPGALAEAQEKRTSLRRRIDLWQAIQDLHMPIVAQLRQTSGSSLILSHAAATIIPSIPASMTPTSSSEAPSPSLGSSPSARAEDMPLWLPSSLPSSLRSSSLLPGLVDKERRLRIAQADDALEEIRRIQRILTGIKDFRYLNISGTGQRTEGRVRSLFTKFLDKRSRAAEKYRTARAALLSVDPAGDWTARFKDLDNKDLRGPHRDPDERLGEGRYQISWIWLVLRAPGESPAEDDASNPLDFIENMKTEWMRSNARVKRWEEEVQLVDEEMRRVVEYLEWKAQWWRKQAARRPNVSLPLLFGLAAYGHRQAAIFEGVACRCASLWVPYLRKRGTVMPAWSTRYSVPDKMGKGKGAAASSTTCPTYSDQESDEVSSDEDNDVNT